LASFVSHGPATFGLIDMKTFYTDHFVLPLPEGHRFPMAKYSLLRQRVVESGVVGPGDLMPAEAATDQQLFRAHDPDYVRRVAAGQLSEPEIRRIGFPWSPGMVERSRRSSGATIAACRAALQAGVAVNLAGGTHHAFRDAGEGYCVFNDSAIAARAMQAEGSVRRILVVDTDVHQGNGTAAILAGDPTVFTFSIHGAKNFPLRKETSDLDVPLPDGAGDADYLRALDRGLDEAFGRAEADLVIFLSGADPYLDDKLGRLKLTKEGLAERDRLVFRYCRSAGLPVVVTMGGGYARQVEDTVDIHFQTVLLAATQRVT
jgi:acetoin utilization deacetylase AcuC-like enzyme